MIVDRPAAGHLLITPVRGLPEIVPGDDLAALIGGCVELADGDVLVVAQKIVSKAEGALIAPEPGETRAEARRRVARQQAARVVADAPWALIVETAHGFVCANAGIDASNVPGEALALLPSDPDASAQRLRAGLLDRTGADVAVIVADTFGRPWRLGQTDVAIGVAGIAALRREAGTADREGMLLEVTEPAVVDELAAAADLVRRKADGVPAVVVRGFAFERDDRASARDLVRPPELDLFARGRGALADVLAHPVREPLGGPVSEPDRLRALRAAKQHTGADVVVTDAPDATSFRFDATAGRALAAGVAAGILMAALADLGYVTEHAAGGTRTIVVRAGIQMRSPRSSCAGRDGASIDIQE